MQDILYFLIGFSISGICVLLHQFSWGAKPDLSLKNYQIVVTQIAILTWTVIAGSITMDNTLVMFTCLGALPMMIALVVDDGINRRAGLGCSPMV